MRVCEVNTVRPEGANAEAFALLIKRWTVEH